LHFFANLNQRKNFEQAFNDGQLYFQDNLGQTPLMIGIKKQSYSVVEVILKFMKSEDRCLLNEADTFKLMNY
jgi:c-di-GMP-related signal transduction protein